MKIKSPLSLRAAFAPLLFCALSPTAHAFVTLTGLTPTSSSGSRISTSTAALTLSDATNTYSTLIGPTEVSVASPGALFQGSSDSATLTASGVLMGNDFTTAVANPGIVRVLFGQTVTNRTGSDVFITEIGTSSQSGDAILNVRAITGGTLANPTYGALTIASVNAYAGSSAAIAFIRIDNGSGATDFSVRGFGLDLLTDLGETSIIGLEFSGNGTADPNLVLAAVPEPSSALLGAIGILALLRRRNRQTR